MQKLTRRWLLSISVNRFMPWIFPPIIRIYLSWPTTVSVAPDYSPSEHLNLPRSDSGGFFIISETALPVLGSNGYESNTFYETQFRDSRSACPPARNNRRWRHLKCPFP